ncbi:MAG TPA: PQQ-binding-like beta-propeller repeat protein [Vicinamibacterales bacterium]|nr:PQQ-binding-like beta-propeller repeat protein [Vicinamibacterales bacterium]
MRRIATVIAAASLAAILPAANAAAPQPAAPRRYTTWSAYGGTTDQIRYSTLRQINRRNVKQLQIAWTYDSGETGGLQTQPVVADGVLYAYTPSHKAFALRADTGELLWTFDSGIKGQGANRGVMYWTSGTDRRVFAAVDQYLYALDAATGKPIPTFGTDGRIDLRRDLGRDPEKQSVRLTSPGVVYKDLLILGGRVSEGLPASPGDIRAYSAKTGELRWSFHTIPHPGEEGYETWSKDSWLENGGANNWPGMALDEARGIVYVPTGSAAADFYGANRRGDNLYANSLVALNADTGKRIWHFQFVRHDIWDRDPPSPPNLVTVRRNGKNVDAVVQSTKQGYVFVFDRANGTPLFPIEYRRYPASDVPGEAAADTQPIPTKPKPFARQVLSRETLTTRTPDAATWAVNALASFRNDGPFVPLSVDRQTVIFPGFDGGAEWGGQAFDPATGLYYVNANDLAWTGGLAPAENTSTGVGLYRQHCASCHRDDLQGTPPQIATLVGVGQRRTRAEMTATIRNGAGRMPGFPALADGDVAAIVEYLVSGSNQAATGAAAAPRLDYRFTGYRKFLDPDGYPAVAPPWGTLSAINLNTGEFAWQIPLGEYPELAAHGLKNTGSENYGGPIVTAGGLVFIGATNFDKKLRAFDKLTGQLLWETTLPFSGNGTPATYEVNGRQYVAIAAGGGKGGRGSTSGGVYVAFALPR